MFFAFEVLKLAMGLYQQISVSYETGSDFGLNGISAGRVHYLDVQEI